MLVCVEPALQPLSGERFHQRSTNKEDGASTRILGQKQEKRLFWCQGLQLPCALQLHALHRSLLQKAWAGEETYIWEASHWGWERDLHPVGPVFKWRLWTICHGCPQEASRPHLSLRAFVPPDLPTTPQQWKSASQTIYWTSFVLRPSCPTNWPTDWLFD